MYPIIKTLIILTIINLVWIKPCLAFDLAQQPFSYSENFEKNDPFGFWISDGTYKVHYKGLTSKKSSSGKMSFKLDIFLDSARYVYLNIPIKVPCTDNLVLKGDLLVEHTSGTQVSLGINTSFMPCKHSGIIFGKRISNTSTAWETMNLDLANEVPKMTNRVLAKYCGGAASEDVGSWITCIGLFVVAPNGGRLTVCVDNIHLKGSVPTIEKYRMYVNKAWSSYIERIKNESNQISDEVVRYSSALPDPQNASFIGEAKNLARRIKIEVKKDGYPSPKVYEALMSSFRALAMIKKQEPVFKTLDNKNGLITFPWQAISKSKVLPNTYPIPVLPGNVLSIDACPGEIEPASFIIRAWEVLTDIKIKVSDLINQSGQRISSDAIDIRLVKCWYQAGEKTKRSKKRVLAPELLIKDDSLIKVNYYKENNYLKVKLNNKYQYIDISSQDAEFPDKAIVKDAKTLQPFSLNACENKQVWLTIRVPDSVQPGKYSGEVTITPRDKPESVIKLDLNILPFDLEPPIIDYCIYYLGRLSPRLKEKINSKWKSYQQYSRELINIKNHGVLYPTFRQPFNLKLVPQALAIRQKIGFPNDILFVLEDWQGIPTNLEEPGESLQEKLTKLRSKTQQWLNVASRYGYNNVYIYGNDEAKKDMLKAQRTAWKQIHDVGAKVFVACSFGAVDIVGDSLDLPVLGGSLKPKEVEKWHAYGKKVFIYGNPQVVTEDPEIYRRNYGFALWCANYDGAMVFTYQCGFGYIWNDFDHKIYRDHVFAYPTSEGVIDTIQWEGFREAVDDVRYLTTLLAKTGGDEEAIRCWMRDRLTIDSDLGNIRKQIIEKILDVELSD